MVMFFFSKLFLHARWTRFILCEFLVRKLFRVQPSYRKCIEFCFACEVLLFCVIRVWKNFVFVVRIMLIMKNSTETITYWEESKLSVQDRWLIFFFFFLEKKLTNYVEHMWPSSLFQSWDLISRVFHGRLGIFWT